MQLSSLLSFHSYDLEIFKDGNQFILQNYFSGQIVPALFSEGTSVLFCDSLVSSQQCLEFAQYLS